jgi:hypothetical protein
MDHKIILEARATLARLKGIEHQRDDVAPEDCVERWKRKAAERLRQRECARAELSTKPVFDYATVQSMIEAAIANERRMLCESLGEEVGRLLAEERREAMRATRDELHMLKLEIAKLATESATLREALANERCRVAGVEPLTRRMN